jgi:glycosyltransferase involved in cell wall biosynthesis
MQRKTARKKVLHLTYDMRIGGTEMVIKNLVEGIDSNQVEASILCIEGPLGPFGEMLREQGFQIHIIERSPGFDVQLIKGIRTYIKQNNIDILHCHQYSPWVYGALAAAFTKTKVIFTEHGRFYPDSSSWKRKLINPILIRFTNYITAISKATKQALSDFEFIPLHKIDVVYNGIFLLKTEINQNTLLKEKYKISDSATILGTIARLDPIKNQTMMIEAFASVLKTQTNIYLFIIGDGEERERLERLVDELSIRDNIIFTGYIAKPVHYLQLIDIFLLSSLSEGTSMTLLEAMSLSKPCVVTDAGGNAEIIYHKHNGLVSQNAHMQDFASNINMLITNKELQQRYANNASKRFESMFTNQHMISAYQAIYNKS